MSVLAEALLIDYVLAYWRRAAPEQLEAGLWIALHTSMQPDEQWPSLPVCRAWFATDRRVEERPVVSFKLFAENKYNAPAARAFEMGEAHLASYGYDERYYLGLHIAPLTGEGLCVQVVGNHLKVLTHLWLA